MKRCLPVIIGLFAVCCICSVIGSLAPRQEKTYGILSGTVLSTARPVLRETDTAPPTGAPTFVPTEAPTTVPTETLTVEPTEESTVVPTEIPTAEPIAEPTTEPVAVPPSTQKDVPPVVTTGSAPCAEGQIKANINSGIYHVPGGASYARTHENVRCFDTEQAARDAGFRRAKR